MKAICKLVRAYADIGRHDQGLSLLSSVQDQFQDQQAIAGLEALRAETVKAKGSFLAERQRAKAGRARKAREDWRRELRRRVSIARERGDAQETARLEQMLQE